MATTKDLKRMCKSYISCKDCPVYDNGCGLDYPIDDLPDNIDEVIDKWVEEHPIKTYLKDFISKFPHINDLDFDFKVTIYSLYCRKYLYGGDFECDSNCEVCWNEEMKKTENEE